MFEQSVLSYGRATKRVWTTLVGLTGEALLAACAVLAPLVWPQVLPRAQAVAIGLLPPVPQPLPADRGPKHFEPAVQDASQIVGHSLIAPGRIPQKAAVILDPPAEAAAGMGVPGGLPGVGQGVAGNGLLNSILTDGARPAPPVHVADPPSVSPKPPVAEIKRYREGGVVKPAVPVFRPEPKYPPMARTARVSGAVEMEAVIGIDGRMREVRVKSGNPLLVPAALEAVRQWSYQPTLLNGEPVEVVTRITVMFRLN